MKYTDKTTTDICFDRMSENLDGCKVEIEAYKRLADALDVTLDEMLLYMILKHIDKNDGTLY